MMQLLSIVSRKGRNAMLLALLLTLVTPEVFADTIPLLAQQTAPRTVHLSWTGTEDSVSIFRQYPDDPQPVQLTTGSLNSWTDIQSRTLCGDTVQYIVCNDSDTGYAAVFVSDNEATSPARWGIVTMDHTTQQIVLHWQPSIDTDIMG